MKKLEVDDDELKEIPNKVDEFSLSDRQLLQLANIGVVIEDIFGSPRDIEWAFYEVRNCCYNDSIKYIHIYLLTMFLFILGSTVFIAI